MDWLTRIFVVLFLLTFFAGGVKAQASSWKLKKDSLDNSCLEQKKSAPFSSTSQS